MRLLKNMGIKDLKLEKFKYTFDSDSIELIEYVPNYNIMDDYKDASESIMKSSMEFRMNQLKNYGYFDSNDCMIVDLNYDFSDSNLFKYIPIMKKIIRDYKLSLVI